MTKAELIAAMVEETGLTKVDCEKALNAFTSNVTETLKQGDEVKLIGFGNFSVKDLAARTGRNPSTGETINIAASKAPKFKAGAELKKALN